MITLLDISLGNGGLVKGDKIINTLVELVGDKKIEDLPIPFTAVAADVKNEKEVWINSGRLFDAIRASISLPLFFTPVKYNNTYLIDGGVLNPVPIAPTFTDDTDITIAVNLGGPVDKEIKVDKTNSDDSPLSSEQKSESMHESVNNFISLLKAATTYKSGGLGAYNVADEAFDAMQSTIARLKLAAYPPDITIEIARNTCGTLEFDLASQMIELGREKTRECLAKAKINAGR